MPDQTGGDDTCGTGKHGSILDPMCFRSPRSKDHVTGGGRPLRTGTSWPMKEDITLAAGCSSIQLPVMHPPSLTTIYVEAPAQDSQERVELPPGHSLAVAPYGRAPAQRALCSSANESHSPVMQLLPGCDFLSPCSLLRSKVAAVLSTWYVHTGRSCIVPGSSDATR